MKVKIKAKPYFNLENKSIEFANKKYIERKPKIANMFEVYNIKGSSGAIAKIAGIESTAKIKSVDSITTMTKSNRVAKRFVPLLMKNLSP